MKHSPVQALKKWLKRQFWSFRHRLSENIKRNSLYEFSIDGEKLRKGKSSGGEELWGFGGSLKWSFSEKGDPLLHDLPVNQFFGWLHPQNPTNFVHPYCILDGILETTATGTVRFSPDTKSPAFGRSCSFKICPKCLGTLEGFPLKL